MTKLSYEQDTEIRDRLDYIAHNLYHDIALFEDMAWSHKTIKKLLFVIHQQQEELSHIGKSP